MAAQEDARIINSEGKECLFYGFENPYDIDRSDTKTFTVLFYSDYEYTLKIKWMAYDFNYITFTIRLILMMAAVIGMFYLWF